MSANDVIPGYPASITLPNGQQLRLQSVTINGGRELFDVTAFGDTFRQRIPLIKDMSGQFTGVLTGEHSGNPFDLDANADEMVIEFDDTHSITISKCVLGNTSVVGSATGVFALQGSWSNAPGSTITFNGW